MDSTPEAPLKGGLGCASKEIMNLNPRGNGFFTFLAVVVRVSFLPWAGHRHPVDGVNYLPLEDFASGKIDERDRERGIQTRQGLRRTSRHVR